MSVSVPKGQVYIHPWAKTIKFVYAKPPQQSMNAVPLLAKMEADIHQDVVKEGHNDLIPIS